MGSGLEMNQSVAVVTPCSDCDYRGEGRLMEVQDVSLMRSEQCTIVLAGSVASCSSMH